MDKLMLICAWCQLVLEQGDGRKDMASHGICADCRASIQEELDSMWQEREN